MKSKILKILIPLSVILSITIGFTVAYFQDVEKSKNNVFSAGTLDLDLRKPGGGEADTAWKAENMIPGDETKEGELEFENKGSIPIKSLLMEVEIK